MAWNKSDDGANAPCKKGSPRWAKGALAGLIVVLLSAATSLIFVSKNSAEPKDEQTKAATQFQTAEPAAPKKGGYIAPSKRKVEKTGDKLQDALAEVSAASELVKIEPQQTVIKDTRKQTKRVFKTGVEQLMGWLMAVEPGDMPMPIPSISDDDRENLVGILMSKNDVEQDDSERIALLKADVDYCKKEMMKFIKEGGDPNDFMQYYFKQLNSAFETRNEVQSQFDALNEEDPDLAKEFLKKANVLLEEKGIKRVMTEEEEAETLSNTTTEEKEQIK